MDQTAHKVLFFDNFALDLTRGCLRAGDQDIDLRPKTFEVLRYLAENAGRLIPKQELGEAVWPNVVVTDELAGAVHPGTAQKTGRRRAPSDQDGVPPRLFAGRADFSGRWQGGARASDNKGERGNRVHTSSTAP